MGRGTDMLKVFGLAFIASYLLLYVTGFFRSLGREGFFGPLLSIVDLFISYPVLIAIGAILIGFIIAADYVTDGGL